MSQGRSRPPVSGNRLLAALAIAAVLVWTWALWPRQPVLTVTFLDVRQGDCAVILTPSGRSVLVDAGTGGEASNGYDVGSRVVTPFLRSRGIRTLDLAVMTHPHEDHIGGFRGVLRTVGVRTTLDCGIPHSSDVYRDTMRLIERRSTRYVRARRGQRIVLPDGVKIEILNPDFPLSPGGDADDSDINNQSVVLRLSFGRASFLFTGDAEREAEEDILGECRGVRSTVLKVSHHGSAEGTSDLWLRAVRPRIAVISVGKFNPFGHPDPHVLQRLADCGAHVFRTDRDGAVTITTDGRTLDVSTGRRWRDR